MSNKSLYGNRGKPADDVTLDKHALCLQKRLRLKTRTVSEGVIKWKPLFNVSFMQFQRLKNGLKKVNYFFTLPLKLNSTKLLSGLCEFPLFHFCPLNHVKNNYDFAKRRRER